MISAIIKQRDGAVFAQAQPHDGGGDRLHHADGRGRPREHRRKRDHDQDQRGQLARLHQHLVDVTQRERTINEEADEQAVEHRHHGGLRGGECSHPHATENHDRRKQTPERLLERLPDAKALLVACLAAEILDDRDRDDRDQHHQPGEDAGEHAGRENRWHRHARRHHRIDDERDRRRNENIGRGRCTHHAGDERPRIAVLDHAARDHAADGRRGRGTRAGDSADHHRDQHGDGRERAAPRADKRGGEAHQPQRDAGAIEHRAHEDEHRDRDQRILGNAGVDVGRHGHDALAADPDRETAREAERNADRHRAEQHQHEGEEQERADHGSTRVPCAVQRASGAPQMRDPGCFLSRNRDPGSASHHCVMRCARDTERAFPITRPLPARCERRGPLPARSRGSTAAAASRCAATADRRGRA